MNAPHGEMNPAGLERLAPRKYVLIHAVDERTVEVEKKGGSRRRGVVVVSHLLRPLFSEWDL